jgi:hypothetical protein
VTQTIEMIWVDPSSRNSIIEPKTLFAMSVLFYLMQKWWTQAAAYRTFFLQNPDYDLSLFK